MYNIHSMSYQTLACVIFMFTYTSIALGGGGQRPHDGHRQRCCQKSECRRITATVNAYGKLVKCALITGQVWGKGGGETEMGTLWRRRVANSHPANKPRRVVYS